MVKFVNSVLSFVAGAMVYTVYHFFNKTGNPKSKVRFTLDDDIYTINKQKLINGTLTRKEIQSVYDHYKIAIYYEWLCANDVDNKLHSLKALLEQFSVKGFNALVSGNDLDKVFNDKDTIDAFLFLPYPNNKNFNDPERHELVAASEAHNDLTVIVKSQYL